jgi:hypothetical protein
MMAMIDAASALTSAILLKTGIGEDSRVAGGH